MQIHLVFETDEETGAKVYRLLNEGRAEATVVMSTAAAVLPEPEGSRDRAQRGSEPADTKKLAQQQDAMAKARAAKVAKATQAPTVIAPVTVALPDKSVELNAPPAAAAEDDIGLLEAAMSPGEAREAGLALVRAVYTAGHVKEVKQLQKEWEVAKFYDIAVEQGHVFYARVMKLAQETGVRK
jgi:hypothetical protein